MKNEVDSSCSHSQLKSFLLLQGSHVSVDSTDGVKLSGVLHTITPFDSKHVVVIKASKVEVHRVHSSPF